MISPSCDFRQFMEAVEDKDYPEIIRLGEQEVEGAERLPYGVKPKGNWLAAQTFKARKERIIEYTTSLRSFLFFLRFRSIRPSDISDYNFRLMRPMCQNLVQKKQLEPEVMNFLE